MLEIQRLSFAFRHRHLFSDVTTHVAPGELVHLVGPNGAGKSTCMAVIAGLLGVQKGSIQFRLRDGSPAMDRRMYLEYLPAEANGLYMKMSARANLQLWTSLRGLELNDNELMKALSIWGLNHPLLVHNFPVEKFSTGMKRRLALARLTLSPAPCWLLDEPVYGLDVAATETFRLQLRQHLERGGMAVIISHDLSAIEGLGARLLSLAGGQDP